MEIIRFIQENFYTIGAGWVVYKFMFPLARGARKLVQMKKVGHYNTLHEARVKTLKPLTRDFGDFKPEPYWSEDRYGKHWVIEMVTGAFRIFFVPFPEDFFDEK